LPIGNLPNRQEIHRISSNISKKYEKRAEALGVAGSKITEPGALKPAEEALMSGEPFVLDVEVDPAEVGYRNAIQPLPIRWEHKPVMSPEEWIKAIIPDYSQ
jgi:thiamine pyrophosphate-dependent acetolactate synthase large subunit-like protein